MAARLPTIMIIVGLVVLALGLFGMIRGNENAVTPLAAGALLASAGVLMNRRNTTSGDGE